MTEHAQGGSRREPRAVMRLGRAPVFMQLIEKTFGKDVTTRTWETLEKVAKA